MKVYNVYESIGNFCDIVFTSDSFNDVQDYLQNRLDNSDVNIDDETEVENFYSYFSIDETEDN